MSTAVSSREIARLLQRAARPDSWPRYNISGALIKTCSFLQRQSRCDRGIPHTKLTPDQSGYNLLLLREFIVLLLLNTGVQTGPNPATFTSEKLKVFHDLDRVQIPSGTPIKSRFFVDWRASKGRFDTQLTLTSPR